MRYGVKNHQGNSLCEEIDQSQNLVENLDVFIAVVTLLHLLDDIREHSVFVNVRGMWTEVIFAADAQLLVAFGG